MKIKTIPGVCSIVNCQGAPISAEQIGDTWISRCIAHFKGRGKVDWRKAVKNGAGRRRRDR
jgi:hypothetical protein